MQEPLKLRTAAWLRTHSGIVEPWNVDCCQLALEFGGQGDQILAQQGLSLWTLHVCETAPALVASESWTARSLVMDLGHLTGTDEP